MPRASVETLPGNQFLSLKRNQACHQCRKRKMKCDAIRPVCSTCAKSHAFAVNTNVPETPEDPVCTYDDTADGTFTPASSSGASRAKEQIKKLESRIEELQRLLLEKDQQNSTPSSGQSMMSSPEESTSTSMAVAGPSNSASNGGVAPGIATNGYASVSASLSTDISAYMAPINIDDLSFLNEQLRWSSWSSKLPQPDALRKQIDVFFACVPLATRLLHRPTFMASLSYHPASPFFPASTLLHAICAMASIYTTSAPPDPLSWAIGGNGMPSVFSKIPTYGELHAGYSKEHISETEQTGERLWECYQAIVILTWYYYAQAKWLEAWAMAGKALRLAAPLKIGVSSVYPALTGYNRNDSILPEPRDTIEAETRINAWWCGYTAERFLGSHGAWSLGCDDEDVTAFLPVTYSDFEAGVDVSRVRQTMSESTALTFHPPGMTDSFSLYIKSAVLVSRIKYFNLRFRIRHPGDVDPRDTSSFKVLDSLCSSFRLSFPKELRDPIKPSAFGSVDPLLFVAHLVAHSAVIVLHVPHVDYGSENCLSTAKMVLAARAIVSLVCRLSATSYDFGLLDPTTSWSWFYASKVLLLHMESRANRGDFSEVETLSAEAEVLRLALTQMAEKIPIAVSQLKMLEGVMEHVTPALQTMKRSPREESYEATSDGSAVEPPVYSGTITNPILLSGASSYTPNVGPPGHWASNISPTDNFSNLNQNQSGFGTMLPEATFEEILAAMDSADYIMAQGGER